MDAATQRLLTRSPLLAGLRRDVIAKWVAKASVRELRRGMPAWTRGDTPAGLVLVRSGVLRETLGEGDDGLILRFAARGEWLGHEVVLSGAPHHTTAVAHEESVVVCFPPDAEPLDGALARRLGAAAADRSRATEIRLVRIARDTVEARLARAVLDLATTLGVRDSRGVIVNLRLTRSDLAALAGTTRESASTVVGRWRRDGVVEAEGRRLVVLDGDALRALAGASEAADRAPPPSA